MGLPKLYGRHGASSYGDTAMSLLDHPEAQALLADAVVLPEDVRGLRDHLTRFLERYPPRFYRQEQRGHAAAFVHWYLHSKNRFTGNYLGPICCVGLRKSRGDVLSAGPGKQGIGDGDGLGSTGTTDTDAGRHHCGETRPPKELRRKSLCRYQWPKAVVS